MKRLIFTLFFIFCFQSLLYAGQVLSSKIENVIVFRDSALIKRKAQIYIKKGENVINIAGLPSSTVDNSIQASIKRGQAKIFDVKVEKTFLVKETQEKVKKIKEKIEGLEGEIKILNAEIKAINNYIDFLKKLSPFTASAKLLQKEFEGYAKFIEDGIRNGYKSIAQIETKLSRLKEEKASLEKELSYISTKRDESKSIILTAVGTKDGETELEISYLVKDASWAPQYELYVDTQKEEINLEFYANIIQNTLEDWKDVKLEITTSKPVSARLSELTPWYIDIYKPREPLLYKDMVAPKAMTLERQRLGSVEEEENKEIKPDIKEEATSFSFAIKDTISIPSDNQPHRIFLASKALDKDKKKDGLIKYLTIPKLSPYVYLTGNFKNPFDFPLFAGKINIYLDGRFVRSEQLNKPFSPDEDMEVTFGIDESIKVERKRVKKFTEYAGIVSKTEKIAYEFEIDIKNGKSKNVNIFVKDNYPVSQNEQIKVTLHAPKENEAEIKKDSGIITWNLTLEPKTTKKLILKFDVEYPKNLRISGLE